MTTPSPMVRGGNREWNMIVRANCTRDSVTTSRLIPRPSLCGLADGEQGRPVVDEQARQALHLVAQRLRLALAEGALGGQRTDLGLKASPDRFRTGPAR